MERATRPSGRGGLDYARYVPPLVRAGLASALLAALAVATDRLPRSVRVGAPAPSGSNAPALAALCPRGTLPDGEVCVPIPPSPSSTGAAQRSGPGARSRSESRDRIERRPDRPADYAKYRLPIDALEPPSDGTSAALELAAARSAAVRLVRLVHEEGSAEVLHAGPLEGAPGPAAVVTAHSVREASGLREYVAIHAQLERVAPNLTRGKKLADGETLGSVGSASNSAPALHYELRRVRVGKRARDIDPRELGEDANSVACDARNVLPLR